MAHIPAVIASEAPNAPTSSVAWMRAATFGVVAFLASDEARWLTGLTIAANGGLVTTAANILARAK